MTVHVVGNATVDLTYRIARFPAPGETMLCTGRHFGPGGKGLNQAVAAARAGSKVELYVALGHDDAAAQLQAAISGEPGLCLNPWLRDGLASDESSIWVAADGENQIVSTAACARSVTPEEAACALLRARPGDILAMQGNLSNIATAAALRSGRELGLVNVVNPAPIGLGLDVMTGLVDVLVVNRVEAAALGIDLAMADLADVAARLGGAVIVTLGADTILFARHDGSAGTHPVRAAVAVDTTGAGDAFVGTLCAALDRHSSLDQAIGKAAEAGRLAVLTLGALADGGLAGTRPSLTG